MLFLSSATRGLASKLPNPCSSLAKNESKSTSKRISIAYYPRFYQVEDSPWQ
eukprot:COSAG06_NODE_14010_length_1197_cov_5666.843352_2_plen_51_part_01